MDGIVAAQRLKRLRYANGLSQQKLAQASGVSFATIRRLETDPDYWDVVTDRTLMPIARSLDVPADYFTRDEDDDPEKLPTPHVPGSKASGIRQEDLQALIAALQPKVQAHKPIREGMDDLPLRSHRDEPWNDKMLCLLEHVRRAVMDWSEEEHSDEYASLLDAITAEVDEWARRHGVPVPDDYRDNIKGNEDDVQGGRNQASKRNAAAIGANETLYELHRSVLGDQLRKAGKAGDLLKPGSKPMTVRARIRYDGDHYDELQVGGKKYLVRCPHDTTSTDVKDHSFVLELGNTRTAFGAGAN
ncbi:helix-turn-helix domain-containing protein [Alicyclobacillus macrosporangiidus]|uniref:helix-turn-helix domain-containing protein n=2 Tax=Alicyclobacillus macrosporangiidus TaxID=392015 RepID=UPI00054FF94B|nr:helix-turn-helix domain-containing protein [Alicyclobacillus macrosporangiidus]